MASSQTIAEAVENSLNAYNILSKKHLESVSYDTTVKAKIVDIKNRDLGEYKVNDGTSIYYAYSDKTDYYNGQTVWVTIPNGDYSQQKFIQGKYVESDNSEPYAYVSPLDSFVDMTQNLIEQGMVNETGLIANGSVKEITLWSIFGRGIVGYDRLAIQAGFKSWLKSLNVQSGDYGLRLDIVGNMTGTSQTKDNRKMYQIVLNTNDFYGDVYNFETFYNQVKVIDISMIDCIESMSLIFYQNDDFRDSGSRKVEVSPVSNIWVADPYISLGFDASRFTQDTVLLTSTSSKTYAPYLSDRAKVDFIASLNPETTTNYEGLLNDIENGNPTTINRLLGELNKKNMMVNYIHINEDDKPIVYGPGDTLPDGIVLHWYHYKLQKDINDELAGNYWEEMAPSVEDCFVVKDFYPNISLGSEMFKVIIENPSKEEIARDVYNDGLFGNLYTEEKTNDQSYYQWVMAGLNALENGKAIAVSKLSREEISAAEQEIYDEYKAALAAKGVTADQALADDINEEYRKRLMNVRSDAQALISEYSELYAKIVDVMAETVLYYSDVLVFTNEEEVASDLTLQLVKGLTLEVDDDYKGNYHIYDEQGNIISKRESQKKRIITAKWDSIITGDYGSSGIESIEWRIPTVNTMIQYPEKGIEYTDYEEIKFDNQIDFESYPYNLYRKKLDSDTDYVLVTDRTTDYRQTFYKRSITSYTPDSKGITYFSIKRPSREFEDHMPGTEEPASSGQIFRIKDFYNENFVNNTIKCIVRKNNLEYTAELTLTFGPTGTAGTDFTFELEFSNKIPALTVGNSSITVIPHLYNYENKDVIEDYLSTLEYGWHSPLDSSEIVIDQSNLIVKKGKITISVTNKNNIENLRYYILGAKVKVSTLNNKEVYLYTYKPVPVRLNDGYISIDGADRVSYNSAGTNPSYYKDSYKIYTYENQATTEIQDVSWQISLGEELNGLTPDPNFYPTLSDQYALIPPSVYIKENGREVAVECIQNGQIIWTQPIYIYQNEYSSALLNSWDGSLTFDEENGIILSRTVGAGSKDDRNRYRGVIMGDVAQVDNTPIYGLYGYSEGVQSFGFKIDGTAFIGKSGKGQINFDGNSGQISSLSRNVSAEKGEGMLIDLDDGFIDIRGSEVVNIKRISDGALLTVDEALQEYYTQMNNIIGEYNDQISGKHIWDEKFDIQQLENAKYEYEQTLADIDKVFDETLENATQEERLKYLRDNNLNYLINNEDYIPVYEGNRTGVHISTVNPYFTITSGNAKDLIHIADDEYYLQTDDFETERIEEDEEGNTTEYKGQGLKINLKGKRLNDQGEEVGTNGYIEGYNFKLKGVNSDTQDTLVGSFFELNSSGSPFLQVHYVNNDATQNPVKDLRLRGYLGSEEIIERDLINISKNIFILQSPDYYAPTYDTSKISGYRKHTILPNKAGEGFLLDLQSGKLEGHNFDISAVNSKYTISGNNVVYDNEAGSYIMLSSSGDPYFRIHYQYVEHPEQGYDRSNLWTEVDAQKIYINKNVDLINISHSDFSITSRDYQAPTDGAVGKGIKFDLSGNKVLSKDTVHTDVNGNPTDIKGSTIEAYSFILDAYRPDLVARDIRSRIRINSSAQGEILYPREDNINDGTEVNCIVPNYDYLIKHDNNPTEYEIQQQIDEFRKLYPSETLTATKNRFPADTDGVSQVKIIKGVKYNDPLMVGGLFSVSWSGKVTAGYLIAKQGGVIGPFTLKSEALYSNNGLLANGKAFYDQTNGNPNTEPEPYGVYLGLDGMSVRDKFVVYKLPINKIRGNKTNLNNLNTHKMRIPIGYNTSTKKQEFTDIKDFVQTGYYTNNQAKEYFLNQSETYDQVFKTVNNNIFRLGDLSFYLNGNSVLNGVTAINGNTYIFGHLQVGEYLDDIGSTTSQTNNSVTLYANTSIWGVFRTTGKTYIGDESGVWADNSVELRSLTRSQPEYTGAGDKVNQSIGAVIYRNTYITGYVRIGGGLVVGDADNISGQTTYDSTKLTSDFTAYVKNARFFGDLEVAAGFVAGSLNSEAPVGGNNFVQLPNYSFSFNSSTNTMSTNQNGYKSGSGIQSKYIFLGRPPTVITNTVVQSDLEIYANTTQYGSFIAGVRGQEIALYASRDGTGNYGFIKINNDGINIETAESKPFSLKTKGGNITIDGTNGSEGSVIEIKAGSKDFIKFNRDGGVYSLNLTSTGTVSLSGGNGNISVNSGGVNISGGNQDGHGVEISGNTLISGNTDITGNTTIQGTLETSGKTTIGNELTVSATTELGGTLTVSGDGKFTGNLYAANLHWDANGATFNPGSGVSSSGGIYNNGSNLMLGTWAVVGNNFSSTVKTFILDADNAQISWGTNNYIDAPGGEGNTGITVHTNATFTADAHALSLKGDGALITAGAGSGTGKYHITLDSSELVITANKNNVTIGGSPLGKLAFMDDVKKKIQLSNLKFKINLEDSYKITSLDDIYTNDDNLTATSYNFYYTTDSNWNVIKEIPRKSRNGNPITLYEEGNERTIYKLDDSYTGSLADVSKVGGGCYQQGSYCGLSLFTQGNDGVFYPYSGDLYYQGSWIDFDEYYTIEQWYYSSKETITEQGDEYSYSDPESTKFSKYNPSKITSIEVDTGTRITRESEVLTLSSSTDSSNIELVQSDFTSGGAIMLVSKDSVEAYNTT